MDLKGKKVLVTGAAGFIGSHLTEELIKKEAQVRVFVRYKSDGGIGNLEEFPEEILEKIEIIRGDLKNSDSVNRAVEGTEVIFHLGAMISIPYSYVDPRDFVETNVIGTLNVLKAAQKNKVKKIIITSTSETYGTAIYSPIDEQHHMQAQSPYSATKISADKLSESFFRTYNLPIIIIRPFNTYGPRQSRRAVIPTIIYQALNSDVINLGSLSPKRDFTFVKDIVEGFIKTAESENIIGETINICSDETASVKEIVKKVEKIMGEKLTILRDENKVRPETSEVFLLIGNNEKAKKLLGWEPKTSLEDGLKETIDYIKDNLNKYASERGNI